jgi:hypothetical protein
VPPLIVDSDQWSTEGANILAPAMIAQLEKHLEANILIVEHRFYRGARTPTRLIFDEFEELERYFAENANPGDSFYFWDFGLCREDNEIVHGKFPDERGRVPKHGVY